MPIPFLLAGLGAAAGILGVGGHLSAQETNEKAQRLSEDAQELYDNAKASLGRAQSRTEASLLRLGYSKKNVMETSIKQFLQSYERIKHINFRESEGINELSKFAIDQQEAVQLREMTDIYQSTFSSGAAGAATGAVVALAASGYLPIVTGTLSTAGTALMAGEVGVAAGLAGTALSFGAAMTPFAAIAAPALLFSGISSSIKADENLEKAQAKYAEAEAKAEKMKTSETMCEAITRRSDMFDGLLCELNGMFSECARLLDGVTKKKTGIFHRKKIDANDFTEEELKLIAVTRALAGAVKSVIDTPILNKEGNLSDEAQNMYEETINRLPDFKNEMQKVESYHINVRTKAATIKKERGEDSSISYMPNIIRNIFALIAATIISMVARNVISDTYMCGSFAFVITALLVMATDKSPRLFKIIKYIISIVFAFNFCTLLYYNGEALIGTRFFLWLDLALVAIFFVLAGLTLYNDKPCGNLRKLLQGVFLCLLFCAIALLLFALLRGLLKVPFLPSIIITEILFAPLALISIIDAQQAYLKPGETIGKPTIILFVVLVVIGSIYINKKYKDFVSEESDKNASEIFSEIQSETIPDSRLRGGDILDSGVREKDNYNSDSYEKENPNSIKGGEVVQIKQEAETKKNNNNSLKKTDKLNSAIRKKYNYSYILPDSNTRYLSVEDLDGLDNNSLRLARNEIFARHGREFETEDLNAYFSNQPWYHGYLSLDEFDDSVLNEYEKANLDLIKTVEGIGGQSESNSQSDTGAFSVAELEGEWWDMNSQRCHMETYSVDNDRLNITIHWSSGAYEGTTWYMDAYYDSATGYLEYRNGKQIHYLYSETAGDLEETVYADGTGRFYLSEGYLYWVDDNENRGKDCYFEKDNETSVETGYTSNTGNAATQTNDAWELPVSNGTSLYIVNCNASITLRDAPSKMAHEITQIPLYSSVQYIDRAKDGFCEISYYGQTGYVLQSYLDVYEPQVYTGIQCVVVNCSESITLRTSISSNDRELCQIPLGATVDYIDSAENGFCLVDYEGIIGYVKEDYLAF